MSSLKLYGSTSGYVEIVPEATAGNNSVTLPNTVGSIAVKDASGNLEVGTGVTIAAPSSDTFTISTNGSERIRVDSSGRLAVGTTPSELFHIKGANPYMLLEGTETNAQTLYIRESAGDMYFGRYGIGTRMVIDSSGRLLVGISSLRASFQRPNINCEGGFDAGITICRNGSDASAPCLEFGKTRSTSVGGNTAVVNGDALGQIRFYGANGTDLSNEGAQIAAEVDGDPFTSGDTTDLPTRLVFSTTADGASSPTERMRLNKDGWLSCQAAYDVTTGTSPNCVVGNTGIFQRSTSSAKYKTQIEDIDFTYSEALLACRPVWYRSTCQVDCPDHSYWGFIAEEVAQIDPRLVHWKTVSVSYNDEGQKVETPCEPDPEGVAYDRFVPHLLNLIKSQKEQIEAMEARLSTLEAN